MFFLEMHYSSIKIFYPFYFSFFFFLCLFLNERERNKLENILISWKKKKTKPLAIYGF